MAGLPLFPLDDLWAPDCASLHPLVCHLCHEQYRQPCLLDCYHIFCASCLHGRASENRLICPLCGCPSVVKGTNALPPEDRLLRFLVENSTESVVQCANCEMECKTQDAGMMYYCNTCSQPLCGPCRETTHKARMFSCHEIVSLAKRAKEGHRKCSLHDELYIMFSTEKKSMLCIKCFRDMQVESRMHCIDIETAYAQGCEILDQAVLAVKELQTSAREAIVLLKAMLGEVRANVEEEESAICNLFNSMREKLADRKRILLKAAQSQHEEKEKALKEQLSHLAALLPTLQVHLVTCSAFLSSANKYEFLDMGYQLMERLCRIVKLPHRLRPTQSSKINTDFRAEFARCLEPLLLMGQRRPGSVSGGGVTVSNLVQSTWSMSCRSPSLSDMPQVPSLGRRPTSHRYICTKVLLAEGGDTPFTEHCRNYENSYRTLQTEIQKLKDQVQEMHRDLTKHHSLINTDTMGEILERSLHIDQQITSQYSSVQTLRGMFEEIWEETFQRVANEQEIYEAQLHDLLQLKQENSYLTTIARQIGPYILSIAKVKERLEPRFQEPKELEDDRTETMLKIYEDSTMTSESQHSDESIYSWDSNRNKRALILQPDEIPPKNTDYRWQSKRNTSEASCRKELPL
ncbi:RING finger protein 207 isoform X2 [Colossoma macropomum]|uniref:RING finger protein 207 isoform X2 n=1 Tax=Colossoma macropomum TaxID=42526 RepID=UPI001864CC8A|nr:RING finger protein 207 isoform X2 [Colossoma macropomum]